MMVVVMVVTGNVVVTVVVEPVEVLVAELVVVEVDADE